MDDDAFFAAFRAGTVDPADFDHRAHVRAALCALDRLPFLEACIALRDGLQRIAQRVARPALYHETMTVAYLAPIADARDACAVDAGQPVTLDALFARRPELLDRRLLASHYRAATLASDSARRRFRMPDLPTA